MDLKGIEYEDMHWIQQSSHWIQWKGLVNISFLFKKEFSAWSSLIYFPSPRYRLKLTNLSPSSSSLFLYSHSSDFHLLVFL
jgi:hypothetical protein